MDFSTANRPIPEDYLPGKNCFQSSKRVIIFDGVCNLCNSSIDFVLRNDPGAYFLFAAQQSDAAQQVMANTGIVSKALDTVILWEGGELYKASTAALRIVRLLRFPWPLLYSLIILPRPIRDFVYTWVARNRYRWFGQRDACRLPSPEERRRFLTTRPEAGNGIYPQQWQNPSG